MSTLISICYGVETERRRNISRRREIESKRRRRKILRSSPDVQNGLFSVNASEKTESSRSDSRLQLHEPKANERSAEARLWRIIPPPKARAGQIVSRLGRLIRYSHYPSDWERVRSFAPFRGPDGDRKVSSERRASR